MSKKKFYAVLNGKEGRPTIYEDWATCQKNVKGVKGGIIFKSFPTKEEALDFLNKGGPLEGDDDNVNIQTPLAIFVDGSFKESDNMYSYGMVVVDVATDTAIHEEHGLGTSEEACELRNVAGEMKGAMRALQYCKSENISPISLCYDYTGIEAWATGKWRRKNKFTEAYYDYMNKLFDYVDVTFVKIKGHSNNKWNDKADELAKEALAIK